MKTLTTHNSYYQTIMSFGMLILFVLGLCCGIAAFEFVIDSPFELWSPENRRTLLKGAFIALFGLFLMMIATLGVIDTFFDHRGG